MIRKDQVVPACDIARKLETLRISLVQLIDDARNACLYEDQAALEELRRNVCKIGTGLENKARERYVASRRGEP